MGSVRLVPLTVKLRGLPAVPSFVVPRFNDIGLTAIVGVTPGPTGLTSALNVTFCVVAPVLVFAICPAKTPSLAAAAAVMRTLIVFAATVPLVGVNVSDE